MGTREDSLKLILLLRTKVKVVNPESFKGLFAFNGIQESEKALLSKIVSLEIKGYQSATRLNPVGYFYHTRIAKSAAHQRNML